MMTSLKTLAPILLVLVLIGAVILLGLPNTQAAKLSPEPLTQVQQDGDEPVVVTVEVPVTVEVTRIVTVVVTPTFTPPPPTPDWREEDDDAYLGSPAAPVKVVEFSDFRCGFCRLFYHTTLVPLTQHYGDLIQFVYRDFPIFGIESINGALAAECAGDQGMFWEYHNLLFDNESLEEPQPLTPEVLEVFAAGLGLDLETWNECFIDPETWNEVYYDSDAAIRWGVTGTPTFFINGNILVGAQPIEVFLAVIDAELLALGIEPPPQPTLVSTETPTDG
jgi:protein-disulfide isomerase